MPVDAARGRVDCCACATRGAALVVVLALIACMAILAAYYVIHGDLAVRSSAARVLGVESELLALSACEEQAAYGVLGLEPPRVVLRVVTNQAGECVGGYSFVMKNTDAELSSTTWQVGWYRDQAGRWRLPTPAYAPVADLRRVFQRACWRERRYLSAMAAACLADALDPDDELGREAKAPTYEALVFARVRPTRAFTAVLCAQHEQRAWLNLGRLARGWGERYTAPMHFVVQRRRSKVSPRHASLVFSLSNLDAASRHFADEISRLGIPEVTPLGVAHQWRGSWIKAVGRDTDSCLGGALTNLMWLRVVDNVVEAGEMRFECEPVLEPTFAPEFVSNALSGTITYGIAGWHVHDDPLIRSLPVDLTEPELSGILAPARCAAPLAEATAAAYVGGAILVRGLDPRERYRVVLVALPELVPHALEVWHNERFLPVSWDGGRALLYEGEPQQPLPTATGEGIVVIVFRVPARALSARQGVLGVELVGSAPSWECYVATHHARDLRLWELAWHAPSGRTQTLQQVHLRCHGDIPRAAGAALVRFDPRAPRMVARRNIVTLPVRELTEGPRARILDLKCLDGNDTPGLIDYRVRLAEPVGAGLLTTSWWVRCWPTSAGVDFPVASTHSPIALPARAFSPHEVVVSVPPRLENVIADVRGGWLECVNDWRAWQGELIVRSPRGELVARLNTEDLQARAPDATFAARVWPHQWDADAEADEGSVREQFCAALGRVANQPVGEWAVARDLLPTKVRSSAAIAAICGDALSLSLVPATLSNTGVRAVCVELNGAAVLSNRVVLQTWVALAPNILRGYDAHLALGRVRLTGLIVSNDHSRIFLDVPGRVPRGVHSVRCTITTPMGEVLWYLPAGNVATCSVPVPWEDPLPAHFSLHVLQPAESCVQVTLHTYAGLVATAQIARSRATWVSPCMQCSGRTPVSVSLRVITPRQGGVVFTRPAWCVLATHPRKNINSVAPCDVHAWCAEEPQLAEQLVRARPLPNWAACARFLPADLIWRLSDHVSFVTLRWDAQIATWHELQRSRYQATFTIEPRSGQRTCAALYRLRGMRAWSDAAKAPSVAAAVTPQIEGAAVPD